MLVEATQSAMQCMFCMTFANYIAITEIPTLCVPLLFRQFLLFKINLLRMSITY